MWLKFNQITTVKSKFIFINLCACFIRLRDSLSHVGALLFKTEAAVRLGYTKDAACTDVLY